MRKGFLANKYINDKYYLKNISVDVMSLFAPLWVKNFSASGLILELNLASGQELDLTIGINQAGDISQLELSSDSELSEADQK